jgi:hypothetical protein
MSENTIGAKMKNGAVVTNVYEAFDAGVQSAQVDIAEVVERNHRLQEHLMQAHESIAILIRALNK